MNALKMPAYGPKIARRVSRLMLAAILLLNTAAIGAMGLQSSLLSQSGEVSTPCHKTGEIDGHHDDHALGCDSLCAQCTGFIPGIFAAPSERMSSTTRFPLTGTDPVPQYCPPLYKPPRA
ncbi:MAG: hypothetical protein OEU50_07220 [Gammaproteobacteria bacterium]|nr:hypothetical protein [Gammaproteobacteria bacterium]